MARFSDDPQLSRSGFTSGEKMDGIAALPRRHARSDDHAVFNDIVHVGDTFPFEFVDQLLLAIVGLVNPVGFASFIDQLLLCGGIAFVIGSSYARCQHQAMPSITQ